MARGARDEMIARRNVKRAVVGLSGGVDSAAGRILCARLGRECVRVSIAYASSRSEPSDAQLVVDATEPCLAQSRLPQP